MSPRPSLCFGRPADSLQMLIEAPVTRKDGVVNFGNYVLAVIADFLPRLDFSVVEMHRLGGNLAQCESRRTGNFQDFRWKAVDKFRACLDRQCTERVALGFNSSTDRRLCFQASDFHSRAAEQSSRGESRGASADYDNVRCRRFHSQRTMVVT